MNVIGCDDVIEHAKAEALLGVEHPMQIAASLARKPEKKLSLMTNAGNSKIKDLTLVVTPRPSGVAIGPSTL
jgi:hypothetical protein